MAAMSVAGAASKIGWTAIAWLLLRPPIPRVMMPEGEHRGTEKAQKRLRKNHRRYCQGRIDDYRAERIRGYECGERMIPIGETPIVTGAASTNDELVLEAEDLPTRDPRHG